MTTCCEDILGVWPGAFPATLNLTITGSCCSDLNATIVLDRHPISPTPRYDEPASPTINSGCDVGENWYTSVLLRCLSNTWTCEIDAPAGIARDPTDPCAHDLCRVETFAVLSCDPFHAIGTGSTNVDDCGSPNYGFCNGSFSFEITE